MLSGARWVDYADAAGQFQGADWSSPSPWCNHPEARLYVGDVSGDDRVDLLCHDVANGTKWTDYADSQGRFLGTDWSIASNWCSHTSAELH